MSAFQRTLDSRPNFRCFDKLATISSIQSSLHSRAKASLFRQVAFQDFPRQLLRASAGLVGNSGEFGFLLVTEMQFNVLKVGASRAAVK